MADYRSPSTAQVAASINNEFGIQLFKSLQSNTEENGFISPLTITSALAMTYMGTRGNTAKQMEEVMKLSSLKNEIHYGLKDLNYDILSCPDRPTYRIDINRLTGLPDILLPKYEPKCELSMANRLYGQKGLNFVPEYIAATRDIYGAQLETVDFLKKSGSAIDAINSWVEEKTAGKIQQVIAPGVLSADSKLVLVNAIYFKGNWKRQFSADSTSDKPFFLSASTYKRVPMMYQKHYFGFLHDPSTKCKVLVMPYTVDINMIVALPDEITGLTELESKLTDDVLRSWNIRVEQNEVRVTLPKFKFTKCYSLADCLISMGISDLFHDDRANLSGIAEEKMKVSEVIHKAFIDVNEEGSEAAAATAVCGRSWTGVSPRPAPKIFRADHPFVFFICDRIRGAVLFLGRVVCPQ